MRQSDRITTSAVHRAIDAVWRIESAKIIAGVARMVRDVGVAEEIAQDALVAALEAWPTSGVPDNPGAWLMATAKRRAINRLRQRQLHRGREEELGYELELRHEITNGLPAIYDKPSDDLLTQVRHRGRGSESARRHDADVGGPRARHRPRIL